MVDAIATPYADGVARDRPDIAALLGPTIESAHSAQFDCGARMGVAVTFKRSKRRYAVKVDKGIDAIAVLKEYIAEYPYGRNRHGKAWEPRNG